MDALKRVRELLEIKNIIAEMNNSREALEDKI